MPRDAAPGIYRLRVDAARYRLASRAFRVAPTNGLAVRVVDSGPDRVAVRLDYPRARENVDLTYRPESASGGAVRFLVDGREVTVRRSRGAVFEVPAAAGEDVLVPAGAARDRHGNVNGEGAALR